jgi:hypothetical protein
LTEAQAVSFSRETRRDQRSNIETREKRAILCYADSIIVNSANDEMDVLIALAKG